MSRETIRAEFRRLWVQSLRQRFQNLNGRDLEAAEDVARRAYLAASGVGLKAAANDSNASFAG